MVGKRRTGEGIFGECRRSVREVEWDDPLDVVAHAPPAGRGPPDQRSVRQILICLPQCDLGRFRLTLGGDLTRQTTSERLELC